MRDTARLSAVSHAMTRVEDGLLRREIRERLCGRRGDDDAYPAVRFGAGWRGAAPRCRIIRVRETMVWPACRQGPSQDQT